MEGQGSLGKEVLESFFSFPRKELDTEGKRQDGVAKDHQPPVSLLNTQGSRCPACHACYLLALHSGGQRASCLVSSTTFLAWISPCINSD